MPTSFNQNDAYHLFVKHQQKVMNSIIPLIQEQRWGVMLKFEEINPDRFAQLVTDAP
ncbi:MAG: hypothetical protein V7L20_04130 [Nostoc sp.]|uniref:hypothetical protein n=1 Tax=Nostoc sp. TaxID=1180 RepID=UPI002FF65269